MGSKTKKNVFVPCSVTGCENAVRTRGLCCKHYTRWLAYSKKAFGEVIAYEPKYEVNIQDTVPTKKCLIPSCEEIESFRGLCSSHYLRWTNVSIKKHGKVIPYTSEYEELVDTKKIRDNINKRGGRPTCCIDDCNNIALWNKALLCTFHNQRWYRYRKKLGQPNIKFVKEEHEKLITQTHVKIRYKTEVCMLDGCNKGRMTQGLCKRHYNRWRMYSQKTYGETRIFTDDMSHVLISPIDDLTRYGINKVIYMDKEKREELILWLVKNFTNITIPDETDDFSIFKPRYEGEEGDEIV